MTRLYRSRMVSKLESALQESGEQSEEDILLPESRG